MNTLRRIQGYLYNNVSLRFLHFTVLLSREVREVGRVGTGLQYRGNNCAEVTIYFVGVRISYLTDSPSKRKMSCVTLGNW